jgi:hypothetical protein
METLGMRTDDLLIFIGFWLFILIAVLWIYKRRRRLYFDSHFVAETTMMNYQNAEKKEAMEHVRYMNEEEREDEGSGDAKDKGEQK